MDTPEQYFSIALALLSLFAILLCCCWIYWNDERSHTTSAESGRLPSRSHTTSAESGRLPSRSHTTSAESIRKPTLDLHGHTVKGAIEETKHFFASHRYKRVRIITGRGNHNPDGLAPIKNEVIKILRNRGLSYYYENDGCLVVDA